MDKKRIIWRAGWFFPTVIGNLGRCGSHQEKSQEPGRGKYSSSLGNSKLRERLGEVEADAPVKAKHVRESVRRIYRDGFHVCNDFYGQRREQDEECMFCDELLYRE